MSRASIERIVSIGPAKQRAVLIFNHLAELAAGRPGSLTEQEYEVALKGFKSDREIDTYNMVKTIYTNMNNFMAMLAQHRLMHILASERLEKYEFMYLHYHSLELHINSFLDLLAPDQRVDAIESILPNAQKVLIDPHAQNVSPKESKKIGIWHNKNSLKGRITNAAKEFHEVRVTLRTSIKAIKDYISETGIKIKAFNSYIEDTETVGKSHLIGMEIDPKSGEIKQSTNAHTGQRIGNYGLYVIENFADIPVDPKLYSNFRKSISGDEVAYEG